ncbi:MAG: flavodoxin domain-containing protein [Bacillota bacterium]
MGAVQIAENIYWVGAMDWNIRHFHGPAYSTHKGTTYNSYLIIDDKVTLVDTVYGPFSDVLLKNIAEITDPSKIDYVVSNHVETDHSGGLPAIMALNPGAKVFCSKKGEEGLRKHYFGDWDYQVVKTGTQVSLGRRSLTFVEAPMLHWPDSMFTYVNEDAILLPNDAFGQHIATAFRFDDEVSMEEVMVEAAKYYANILTPFSDLVLKKLEEVTAMGIPIKMIGPSHGIIWRKDPSRIIRAYASWARGDTREKAVIAYDTMWESTAKMGYAILQGFVDEGVEAKLYAISSSDRNDIIKEILDARMVVVGSPTINKDFLATVGPLLDDLKGLRPKAKLGAAFGSYGWSGESIKNIEERLASAGVTIAEPGLRFKWVPTEDELERSREYGRNLARRLKDTG